MALSLSTACKQPQSRPRRPYFSSGPVVKFKGWRAEDLAGPLLARSHRSSLAKTYIEGCLQRLRHTLNLPTSYEVVLMPGSATGAMGAALWNFLGLSGVDVWSFDLFGQRWADDVRYGLKLGNARFFDTSLGTYPPLDKADFDRDQVFVWNGTTSGICLQNQSWIPQKRTGLTICDATSAVLCCDLPWPLLDVTAFSLQKGFGGEAGLGFLVLSARAIEHLRAYMPSWPIPRVINLRARGKLREKLIFEGEPLNTLSLLTLQDFGASLKWIEKAGGLKAMLQRVTSHAQTIDAFVKSTDTLSFLVNDSLWRSESTACLVPEDAAYSALPLEKKWGVLRDIADLLEKEKVAYDILGHINAEPCLRLWCGPTVEAEDLCAVLPWIRWAAELVLLYRHRPPSSPRVAPKHVEDIDFKENLPYNKKDEKRKGRKHVF